MSIYLDEEIRVERKKRMSSIDMNDRESVKALFKEALVEVLREEKDLLESALAEAVEDIGMLNAIHQTNLEDNIDTSKFLNELDTRVATSK